jgi:hypothetical protein
MRYRILVPALRTRSARASLFPVAALAALTISGSTLVAQTPADWCGW